MRLDQALTAQGLLPTRAKARLAVLSGAVLVNGGPAQKPGQAVRPGDALTLQNSALAHYVGRGSLKLLHALDCFALSVAGLACLDAGASTGGFTQVLLERGAARVTALDVGSGQLAGVLRGDPRVEVREQCDLRDFTRAPFDFLTADLSFISLRLLLEKIHALLKEDAAAVVLLKPQFELDARRVGKGGVVKDARLHEQALEEFFAAARNAGFCVAQATPSPVLGGNGNCEFLLHLTKLQGAYAPPSAKKIVQQAWEELLS